MSDNRAFNRLVLAFRSGTLDDQVDAIALYVDDRLAERESKLERRYMDLGELAARYKEALREIAAGGWNDVIEPVTLAKCALGSESETDGKP